MSDKDELTKMLFHNAAIKLSPPLPPGDDATRWRPRATFTCWDVPNFFVENRFPSVQELGRVNLAAQFLTIRTLAELFRNLRIIQVHGVLTNSCFIRNCCATPTTLFGFA